jgi:hypothetical protein
MSSVEIAHRNIRAMGDEDGPRAAKAFYEKLFESSNIDVYVIIYALTE